MLSQLNQHRAMGRARAMSLGGQFASAMLARRNLGRAALNVPYSSYYEAPGQTAYSQVPEPASTSYAPAAAAQPQAAGYTPPQYMQPQVPAYMAQQYAAAGGYPPQAQQLAPESAYQATAAAAAGAAEVAAGPGSEYICDFDEQCVNTVALTGVVVQAPHLQVTRGNRKLVEVELATYDQGLNRSNRFQFEAWGDLATQIVQSVQLGTPVCINGRLSYGYNRRLKVVASAFWLVDQSSVPPDAFANTAAPEGARRASSSGRSAFDDDVARLPPPAEVSRRFHEAGETLASIAASHGAQLTTALIRVLEAAATSAGPPTDWRRLCAELGLGSPGGLRAADVARCIEAAAQRWPGEVTRAGLPKLKPMREEMLADGGLRPLVEAQAAGVGGQTLTYCQLRLVQAMRIAGVDLGAL